MLKQSEAWDERAEAARAVFALAERKAEMGQLGSALRLYGQALAMQEPLGDRIGQAATLHGMGVACAGLDRFTEAQEHLEAALRLNRACGDVLEAAATLARLAELANRREDGRRYVDLLLEAIGLLSRAQQWGMLYLALTNVAAAAPRSRANTALQAVWLGLRVEAPAERKAEVALWAIPELGPAQPLSWRLAAYSSLLEAAAGDASSDWRGRGRGSEVLEACAQHLGVQSPEALAVWVEREGLGDPARLRNELEAGIEARVPGEDWYFNREAARGQY